MDEQFQQIYSYNMLSGGAAEKFTASGFLAMPGPLSGDTLNELIEEYDDLMAPACGPDFKIAGTTTRMTDLLSLSSVEGFGVAHLAG